MNRSEFIKICGGACLGIIGFSGLLQSCGSVYWATHTKSGKQILLNKSEFEKLKDGKITLRDFVLIKSSEMDFPVLVNRLDESAYAAFEMKCTHQGNVLAVSGNMLTCSAHGSEFDFGGNVLQGPATDRLKKYNVTVESNTLIIHLD